MKRFTYLASICLTLAGLLSLSSGAHAAKSIGIVCTISDAQVATPHPGIDDITWSDFPCAFWTVELKVWDRTLPPPTSAEDPTPGVLPYPISDGTGPTEDNGATVFTLHIIQTKYAKPPTQDVYYAFHNTNHTGLTGNNPTRVDSYGALQSYSNLTPVPYP